MRPSLTSFANELCKVADRKAMQAMIDKKLAPFQPAPTQPMLGPVAKPPPPPPAPKTMDQRIQDTGAQIRQKIQASGPHEVQIKRPQMGALMGVRG